MIKAYLGGAWTTRKEQEMRRHAGHQKSWKSPTVASRPSRAFRFYVNEGELVTLIRCQRRRQVEALRALSGLIRPAGGMFLGEDITGIPSRDIGRQGIAFVPGGSWRIFARLSVHENLLMGAFARNDRRRSCRTSTRSSPWSRA